MPKTKKQRRYEVIQRQINRLEDRCQGLQHTSSRFAQIRVAVFIGGFLLSLIAFYSLALVLGAVLAVVTIILFSGVVVIHRRVDRALQRYWNWQDIKRAHCARMLLDWEHIPAPPEYDIDANHPFEIDLNLTGSRSLHHLMDTATSFEGSGRLREWLLASDPDPARVTLRQQAIDLLTMRTRFRDRLALQARLVGTGRRLRGNQVQEWFAEHPATGSLRQPLGLAALLSAATIVLLLLSLSAGLPPLFLFTFTLYGLNWGRQWQPISELLENARSLYYAVDRLRGIFLQLENERDPVLEPLLAIYHHQRPSRDLAQVTRILAASSLQGNPILWLFVNLAIPWDLFFAYQLNRSKRRLADRIPAWLDAWYELEALGSLANFAYLNPAYRFPTVTDENAPHFRATQLGHPLIPDDQRVTNDFALDQIGAIVIITGSNMSGKSTFLRTIGVNLVLAYAGAPVNAAQFMTTCFRLYTSMKISDSLSDGISYFYAEVKRLKRLLGACQDADAQPVFFMIDEIFRGTNNRERLIGSRAYIQALVGADCMGLVATHDLELVQLAELFEAITNYHFREDVSDGRMVFDYRLRPGPCPTTNALQIMAIEGLPVELHES